MKQSTSFLLLTALLFVACQNRSVREQYLIAYNVLYDEDTDNYEVFAMNMDGSEKRNITNLGGVEWAYHAYADRILFLSDKDTVHRIYHLYEMNALGEDIRKVCETRMADSWMSTRKNGGEIIIRPHSTVDSAFHIISSAGELLQRVETGLPAASDPAFVGDGRKIVFRGGTKHSKREKGYVEELYIINDDGTGLRQLTHYPENDTTAPWYAYKAGPPIWNAAGGFVSYQSYQNGKYSLFAVSLEGSDQRKLTENPQGEGYHHWSPDGKWLAIEVFDREETQFHIALMNWDTKDLKILTDTTYTYQQSPVFVRK